MLNQKMQEALNAQLNDEMSSSYLYLSMSAYAADINFHGFAHWMRLQAEEEWGHAMKIHDYILERGGKVLLRDIKKPAHTFKSIRNMIEMALQHEKRVTQSINKLYELAGKEKDYASQVMLQWFVNEQVEEEAAVSEIVEKTKMIPDKSSAILFLDKALKKRGQEK